MDRLRAHHRLPRFILAFSLAWPSWLAGAVAAAPRASDGVQAEPAIAAPARGTADPAPNPPAAPTDARIKLVLRASGLTRPVFVTSARDGSGRLFIVEQTGRIKILKSGHVLKTPFLNLAGKVSGGNEQGLLGLAFHPDFKANRKLYVNYTDLNGETVILEYRASTSNPNV